MTEPSFTWQLLFVSGWPRGQPNFFVVIATSSGDFSFDVFFNHRLQAVQKISGPLRVSGSAEDRALVFLQDLQLSRGRHNAEEVRQCPCFPGGLFTFLRIIFDARQSVSNQSSTLWSRRHDGGLSVFGLSTRSSAFRLVSRFACA